MEQNQTQQTPSTAGCKFLINMAVSFVKTGFNTRKHAGSLNLQYILLPL
jgi:hypothetical protein